MPPALQHRRVSEIASAAVRGLLFGAALLLCAGPAGGSVQAQGLPGWAEPQSSSRGSGAVGGERTERPERTRRPDRPARRSGREGGGQVERPEWPPNRLSGNETRGQCGGQPCSGACCQKKNGDIKCFPNKTSCPGNGNGGGGGFTQVPLSPTGLALLAAAGAGYATRRLREGDEEDAGEPAV
jgi:hypothetical protein